MSVSEINENLQALYAYDTGCTDSGIKSDELRNQIKKELENMDEDDLRIILSKHIRDYYLIDEALDNGYGIEDVKEFIHWLDEYMDINI